MVFSSVVFPVAFLPLTPLARCLLKNRADTPAMAAAAACGESDVADLVRGYSPTHALNTPMLHTEGLL